MSLLKNTFTNIKEQQNELPTQNIKFENRHHMREAHGITEGIRKDKKIKISKKFK